MKTKAKPARPMTERQAWLWLAKAWQKAKADKEGGYFIPDLAGRWFGAYGLCHVISNLLYVDRLDQKTADQMTARIGREFERRANGERIVYLWPFNSRGRDARVRFCERQAKALTRKVKA